ncbi:hypothetical protein AQF52_5428 [Streptomyces venezuelae]|uniref:DUF6584 family protein n=1 Tax=Streptomyces gardneri TaxID=66892 RepID=UPI0006BC4E7F|nr:DUF6584 family protein [Streptomyces gardneri]ALO11022.1 hypothetical protein AQF52_5428 [Streptomyces venezuelae]QPK47966.1 hypothetical protein H4W23_27240 [Streptomyces gardneri]WRK39421.1 DUF6584 family protein [Streptomyces venezuelae]CUM38474.1 hypothetical protein BN2537_5913 [Streptomyces venezuelae]
MPLSNTLDRVDADLAAGRVPMARQRLRGLVSSYPYDLTLRRRLAEVYRLYGDAAEAGRWMYLEEDRDADETAAFEARYLSPAWRMKVLAWRGPEALAGTAVAEERLVAVRTACAEWLGHSVDWDDPASYGADAYKAYEGPDGGSRLGAVVAAIGAFLGVTVTVGVWIRGVIALFE